MANGPLPNAGSFPKQQYQYEQRRHHRAYKIPSGHQQTLRRSPPHPVSPVRKKARARTATKNRIASEATMGKCVPSALPPRRHCRASVVLTNVAVHAESATPKDTFRLMVFGVETSAQMAKFTTV